jgi:hypothetical protein
MDRGECLHLLCQHVSLAFELPDFGVQLSHLAWSVCRAGEGGVVLEGTVLDIDFGLHLLELVFRLGEFGCRGLLAPLERAFGHTPLLVLLDEPCGLAVQPLYWRVCSCVSRALVRSASTYSSCRA